MFIYLTRGTINQTPSKRDREWLVTNGIGGFAAGTISGVLTRRYHGLLVAALDPPLGRTLLCSKIEETVLHNGRTYDLFTNSWQPEKIYDHGYQHLDLFALNGTTPVWTYAIGDGFLTKKIWMADGENTTIVQYRYGRSQTPISLSCKLLVNYRDYHATTQSHDWVMDIKASGSALTVQAHENAVPFYIKASKGMIEQTHDWYHSHYLAIEADRGLDMREDFLLAGTASLQLEPEETVTILLTTQADRQPDGDTLWLARKAHEEKLWAHAVTEFNNQAGANEPHPAIRQLVLAADQFIVKRATPIDEDGRSIIAGYPWFGDWGRDTMIALPGLTLATGRPEIARKILRTYSHFVKKGMIPNRFPDENENPEYNTADATLWFFEALRAYTAKTGDLELAKSLYPTLEKIIAAHRQGTRFNIHEDPADGLLYAGEEEVQLTWMDAKVGDWVVTPRIGKPVEINALWYNAIGIMAELAERLGHDETPYREMADQVEASFQRFWSPSQGYCFDVIDGPDGAEALLRPNQLLAVSLNHSPLQPSQRRAVVDICAAHLVTPHGVRSLAPFEKGYFGRYGGSTFKRDGAYHQGTVWGWLLGPFVEAHYRVYRDKPTALSFFTPLLYHLWDGCVGTLSEIFDGKPPFTPRGAFAQAWTVAEVLRVWQLLHQK